MHPRVRIVTKRALSSRVTRIVKDIVMGWEVKTRLSKHSQANMTIRGLQDRTDWTQPEGLLGHDEARGKTHVADFHSLVTDRQAIVPNIKSPE